MFIELVDQLRCPVSHETSWLIAVVEAMQGRYIQRGALGCPVCRAQYEIRDFVTFFADPVAALHGGHDAVTDDAAARLAAQLDLTQRGGYVLLSGAYGRFANTLATTYDVHCVVLDRTGVAAPADGLSVLCSETVPLAPGSARGAAVESLESATLPGFVAALRPGGRLVSPASQPIPDGIRQLARDEREWVGEREAAQAALIGLGRASARD